MSVIFAIDVFSVIRSYFTRLFSCIGYIVLEISLQLIIYQFKVYR